MATNCMRVASQPTLCRASERTGKLKLNWHKNIKISSKTFQNTLSHTFYTRASTQEYGSTRNEITVGDDEAGGNHWTYWDPKVYAYSNSEHPGLSLSARLPPPLLSVAPMMEYTDAHFRQLARLLSRHTWLYTEMVVDNTLIHQQPNLDRWLEFPKCQHPLVLQLGGSNPEFLKAAVQLVEPYGYDEINLNCGCPSSAVAGHGCFGARLMTEPKKVAEAVSAMASACSVPITVKCRIGVDDYDSYEQLCDFIATVTHHSPVQHFCIHARKAYLKGLNPAQNRSVPPLKYEYVLALKRDFPDVAFTINGGFTSLSQATEAISWGLQGVMIGRAAYKNPWAILGDADRTIYGVPNPAVSRRQVLEDYAKYARVAKGRYGLHRPNLRALTNPLLSLFYSEPGGANWRRSIEGCIRDCSEVEEILAKSLPSVPDYVLDSPPGSALINSSINVEVGALPDTPHCLKRKEKEEVIWSNSDVVLGAHTSDFLLPEALPSL